MKTWRISKKYRGIHKSNFERGTPFVAKIGRYYIVENEEENSNIVYSKKMKDMGVVSGSLIVKIESDSDVESLLDRWEHDETVEVGSVFFSYRCCGA